MKRFTQKNTTGFSGETLDLMNNWFERIMVGITIDDENYRIIADNYSNIVLKTFDQYHEKVGNVTRG